MPVLVAVRVRVVVIVGVLELVAVPVRVAVAVGIAVAVRVAVPVGVAVAVAVRVGVAVPVEVTVGGGVRVNVAVGCGVWSMAAKRWPNTAASEPSPPSRCQADHVATVGGGADGGTLCTELIPAGAGVGATLTGVGPAIGVPAPSKRRSSIVVAAPARSGRSTRRRSCRSGRRRRGLRRLSSLRRGLTRNSLPARAAAVEALAEDARHRSGCARS